MCNWSYPTFHVVVLMMMMCLCYIQKEPLLRFVPSCFGYGSEYKKLFFKSLAIHRKEATTLLYNCPATRKWHTITWDTRFLLLLPSKSVGSINSSRRKRIRGSIFWKMVINRSITEKISLKPITESCPGHACLNKFPFQRIGALPGLPTCVVGVVQIFINQEEEGKEEKSEL